MVKALALYSCRADEGLLDPVVKELRKLMKVEKADCYRPDLACFEKGMFINCDMVVCPCDRKEIVMVALKAFYNNVPIAQIDAGETESGSSYDNTGRWALTRLSSLIFTNNEKARETVIASGEDAWRVHNVGYTFMDGVKILAKATICEKYKLPDDYDIMIYNPDVYSEDRTRSDMETIVNAINKFTVVLKPNNDINSDIVNDIMDNAQAHRKDGKQVVMLIMDAFDTRDEFLTALKYCKRFIGNSSAMLHEAPHLGVQCMPIGERNKGRPIRFVAESELGASKRIAIIIHHMLKTVPREELIRKRVRL